MKKAFFSMMFVMGLAMAMGSCGKSAGAADAKDSLAVDSTADTTVVDSLSTDTIAVDTLAADTLKAE